jgi:hypothetical protein
MRIQKNFLVKMYLTLIVMLEVLGSIQNHSFGKTLMEMQISIET